MAGWSMIADGSALDCPKSPRKVEPSNFCVELDLELQSESTGTEFEPENVQEGDPDKLRCGFDQILRNCWEQTGDRNSFRSFPVMLGDGIVDLYNLFVNVTQKGGYDAVSENGLWRSVVEECGYGVNNVSAVKLVYIKYLDPLERWVAETVEKKGLEGDYLSEEFGWFYMELEAEFKDLLWRVSNQKKKSEEFQHLELARRELTFCDRDEKCFDDREFLGVELEKSTANSTGVGKLCDDNEAMSMVVELDGDKECVDDGNFPNFHLMRTVVNLEDSGRLCNNGKGKDKVAVMDEDEKLEDDDENVVILNDVVAKEEISSRKRKRECMWELLNWVTKAAKNPCDPVIGSLRESSKWKSNVNEEFWKQVLLVREAIFFKRVQDSSAEKSWQKNQKMHPCMYEDHIGSSYNLRERLGCGQEHLSGKLTSQSHACPESPSSGTQSDLDKSQSACMAGVKGQHYSSTPYSLFDDDVPNKIPLGLSFQAEIPEWTGVPFESDSKWLGTQFWPLEKEEHRFLIERDYIGKGRQDSCGCEVQGCVECVRFHSTEKRLRLKRELGSAFYHWKFDKMGEEVSLSWTRKEEKRFKAIMRLNSPSVDTSFWDELFKVFPKRKREDLVSYYYNVFLLRRRGYQNRFTPNDIDSDDDESGSGLVTNTVGYEAVKSPNSILYSPNKKHTSFR